MTCRRSNRPMCLASGRSPHSFIVLAASTAPPRPRGQAIRGAIVGNLLIIYKRRPFNFTPHFSSFVVVCGGSNLDGVAGKWRSERLRRGSVMPCIYSAHYLLFALITVPRGARGTVCFTLSCCDCSGGLVHLSYSHYELIPITMCFFSLPLAARKILTPI